MKEPIKIEKDHNKKDDKISKNFINEIGFTRKPEEKKFNNSNSYKESNNNNINLNIISKSKKENVPQIMDINIDSQANPFERALSSGIIIISMITQLKISKSLAATIMIL